MLGKLSSKSAKFLLNTGFTTSLLSRHLFDMLSTEDRANLNPCKGEHNMLVDRLCIPFYGIIELTERVLDQVINQTFIVSQLKENAILGMPFLKRHMYHIDINKLAVMMTKHKLACLDKLGRPLVEECRWCGTVPFLDVPRLQSAAE